MDSHALAWPLELEVRREHQCARQLFGLLLIPTPNFWVDSTPWMGGLVGGWVGGMGQLGMISPCGLAPFRLGIWTGPFPSPIVPQVTSSPSVMRFRATRCIYVYC